MELKEFRKDFENNILMFNSGLDSYIKIEKPNNLDIERYSVLLFSYYYPQDFISQIEKEIIGYSQNYLALFNLKKDIKKKLYKMQKVGVCGL